MKKQSKPKQGVIKLKLRDIKRRIRTYKRSSRMKVETAVPA